MLQARLLRLSPELRRILRAASVFGAAFFRDAIVGLLGSDDETLTIEASLHELCRAEILEPRGQSRRFAQPEFGWRHALMQQAAYNLLSERDRRLGHAQAAQFLLASGSAEPAELASHFERGGDKARALPLYLEAAQHAFDQLDLSPVLRYIERAFACGAQDDPDMLARASALQCLTYRYTGEHARMMAAAEVALPLLEPGASWWYRVLYNFSFSLRLRGARARVIALAELWASVSPLLGAEWSHLDAGVWFTVMLAQMAEWKAATLIWQRLAQAAHTQERWPQYLVGMFGFAHYEFRRNFDSNPWTQFEELGPAVEHLMKAGGQRDICAGQISRGQAQVETGDIEGGIQHLEHCVRLCERARQPYIVLIARAHLMAALAERRETAERASQIAREILDNATAGDGFRGWAHTILGQDWLRRDALEEAAAHLQKAVTLSQSSPLRRMHAASLQVHLLLRMHKLEDARAHAESLLVEAAERGGGGYCAAAIGLAASCARFHSGDEAGAVELQRATLAEVMRRASHFPDETTRQRYLHAIAENAALQSPAPWSEPFPARFF